MPSRTAGGKDRAPARRHPWLRAGTALALLALSLLAGCQPARQQAAPGMFEEWKARAERSRPVVPVHPQQRGQRPTPIPAAGREAGTAPPSPDAAVSAEDREAKKADPRQDLPSQKVSVRFVDDALPTVLRALARMAGQNVLISPNVTGTVNLHIENMPWDVVFTGLIDAYGLILRRDGRLLRVLTVDDVKQEVERQGLEQQKTEVAPLHTRAFPIEYADPAEIAAALSPMLSKDGDGKERGSISVNQHARSLVVTETEDNMARMAALIATLDRPTPQILIEAHIVETSQDTARELGIQWGGFWRESLAADRTLALTPGGVGGVTDQTTGFTTYQAGTKGQNRTGIGTQGFGVDLPAQAMGNFEPASFGFLLFNNSGDILDMQLSALQKEGKINILSQPSIVTLDNNEAVIESGRDIPFQTIEDNTVKIEYKEATLKLTVTPHVIADTLIKLDLEAKKDEVDFTQSVGGNPTIIKKQAHTQLLVEDGATVVIAGLSKERTSRGQTGVPGLQDLPILGRLFRNDTNSSDFEEVLIFITPHILGNPRPVAGALPAGTATRP